MVNVGCPPCMSIAGDMGQVQVSGSRAGLTPREAFGRNSPLLHVCQSWLINKGRCASDLA